MILAFSLQLTLMMSQQYFLTYVVIVRNQMRKESILLTENLLDRKANLLVIRYGVDHCFLRR